MRLDLPQRQASSKQAPVGPIAKDGSAGNTEVCARSLRNLKLHVEIQDSTSALGLRASSPSIGERMRRLSRTSTTRTLASGSSLQRASGPRLPVAISKRPHPIPFRTRKLSSSEPMVLLGKLSGRVGRCRDFSPNRVHQTQCLECAGPKGREAECFVAFRLLWLAGSSALPRMTRPRTRTPMASGEDQNQGQTLRPRPRRPRSRTGPISWLQSAVAGSLHLELRPT